MNPLELLGLAAMATPYMVAVLLGVAVPLLVLMACRSAGAGLALIGVAWAAELATMSQPVLHVAVFLHVADVLLVLVAAAAALRWLLPSGVPSRHPAWIVTVLLLVVGIAWGLAVHGRAAGVQSRPDFYAVAAASCAMSFHPQAQPLRLLVRLLLVLAAYTLLLTAWRWTVTLIPLHDLLPPGGTYNVDGPLRVVPSNAALLLAQLLVLALFFGGGGLTLARWLSPLLLAAVLVLQHRSVWLAAIVGVLVGAMAARSRRVPRWQQALLALAVVAVTALALGTSDRLTDQLRTSAQRALAGRDTVADRFQNWRATLRQWVNDGPVAIAVGRIRGADARRGVEDESGRERIIEYQAHNHYVNTLAGSGVIGLAAYAWWMAWIVGGLMRALRTDDAGDRRVAAALLVLLAMQITYYIAYGVEFVQYALAGLAMAWVAAWRQRQRAAAAAPAAPTWRSVVAWR